MRNLQTKDLFNLARLINKLDIKEEIKNIDFKKSQEEAGFDLIFIILNKANDKGIENAVYQFLSGPFEISEEEVSCLDPLELVKNLFEIASIDKWRAFIKQAVR